MIVNRRGFLGVAASGLLAACASLVTTPVTPVGGRVRLVVRDYPTLDRPGGSLKIRPDDSDRVLYVLRQDNATYSVVSPICKHRGCTVDVEGAALVCPCHGSMYGRDGRVLRGPTQAPLDRFPATLTTSGELVIDLNGALT